MYDTFLKDFNYKKGKKEKKKKKGKKRTGSNC